MNTSPDRRRVRLPGISTRAWEHPADRTALVTLRSLSGFDVVLRTLSGLLQERRHRLLYLATAVRVDERQFRTLHHLREDCVGILDAKVSPEMFVLQSPEVNAFTIGMDTPFVVLTTGMIELMDTEELRFVIGHELGHALSGHAVYRTMLLHLLRLSSSLGWMPVGGWAVRAIVAALMVELQTHPFSVLRAAELRRWIQSGDYERVLAGDYPRREQDREARIREQVREAARTYKQDFDTSEDPLIRTVRTMGRDMGAAMNTVGQEVGDTVTKIGRRLSDWRGGLSE
ncbi:M48 family metallopeptidase [Nocardia takedensis]|uniref:M48 family metallopeptidase n=1 Tax=Nocardia takedensis TaxID=259390 RepID=UPI0002DBA8B6|nr:M48 family metallopeptidase [Nocardia takedensis]